MVILAIMDVGMLSSLWLGIGNWWGAWKRKSGISSEGPKQFELLIKCLPGNEEPPGNLSS